MSNILEIKASPAPQQFDTLYKDIVDIADVSEIQKRYIMLLRKKRENQLPLTKDELKQLKPLTNYET